MASTVWVKVMGFTDVERHSINTLLRLSQLQEPSYSLWTRDAPSPPQVALIDVDSYEAGLELASPSFNPNMKLICVGSEPLGQAWQSLARPIDWVALVRIFDGLFGSQGQTDIDTDFDDALPRIVPPGVRVSLLVGLPRDEGFYLRARLALAGFTDVDEVDTNEQALAHTVRRHYNLVVVRLDLAEPDPWVLLAALKNLPEPPHALVVATTSPSWAGMEQAEQMGCMATLEIPFSPEQVWGLLHKV
jgi:CheY-like chemotaxis protein